MRFGSKASPELEALPHSGRLLDARLHLLDRQIIDAEGDPAGTVDDLELDDGGDGPPTVTGVLTGQVLIARILGGQPPPSRMETIPWESVDEVGIVVSLTESSVASTPQWREKWLRDHVIAHIPGGRRAAE